MYIHPPLIWIRHKRWNMQYSTCIFVMLANVVQVMLVSLGLCLPSATTSGVSLFGTDSSDKVKDYVVFGYLLFRDEMAFPVVFLNVHRFPAVHQPSFTANFYQFHYQT